MSKVLWYLKKNLNTIYIICLNASSSKFIRDSEEHYSVLLREVLHAKSASKKTAKHYRRLKKYDILVTGHEVVQN